MRGCQLLDSRVDPGQRRLELQGPGRIRVDQLAADLPLAESQQQLLRGALVDALRRGAGVELREETHEIAFRLGTGEQLLAKAAELLAVEVLGPELREDGDERAMRCHAGERVLLEPLTGIEQPRRDAAGRRRRLARGKPLLRLLGKVELVGRVADRVLALG